MLAFVFVAWEISFGLWLQTHLCSKADFECCREMSPPQLTSLPRAWVHGRIPSAQTLYQIQLLSDTAITMAWEETLMSEKSGVGMVPRS